MKINPGQSYEQMKSGSGVDSWYDETTKEIHLGSFLAPSIGMHETQHAIQDLEGWFKDRPETFYQDARLEKGTDLMESIDYRNSGLERQARAVNDAFSYGYPENGAVWGMGQSSFRDANNPFEVGSKEFEEFEYNLNESDMEKYDEWRMTDLDMPRIPNTQTMDDYNVAKSTEAKAEEPGYGMIDDVVLNDYPGGPDAYTDDLVSEWYDENTRRKIEIDNKKWDESDSAPTRTIQILRSP